MYTTKEAIKRALQFWCAQYNVPLDEVVVFGSSALLFHDLADVANDIDIELSLDTIDRLAPHAIVNDIEGALVKSVTYLSHDIEHVDDFTDKPWVLIEGLKICTLERLREDYKMFNRPKDLIKLQRMEWAIRESKASSPLPALPSWDPTPGNKRVVFEQYRDVNNTYGVFGYVLRWTLDKCVTVDVFEIITGRGKEDGWWTGLDFEPGDESMDCYSASLSEIHNELDFINPNYHLYMKYDGTAHLWQSNYSGSGDAESIFCTTEMLRYVATRAARYIQDRLNVKEGESLPDHRKVFPLNYNVPEIQVRPYVPDPA